MDNIDIQLFEGQVVAVDVLATDVRGVNIPVVHVKSSLDGLVLPIQWLPIGADQAMPMVGNTVLYYRMGNFTPRIVAFHGNNEPQIRKGAYGLNPGETVVQSDSGFGYFKAAQDGSVALVTGDGVSSAEADDTGWKIQAPNINLATFGLCSIQMTEDGAIRLLRKDKNGNTLVTVELDKNNNVNVDCPGNFTVKAKQILLDGNVVFGPGATDPTQSSLFGQVVTSGPFGTHPLDYVTGTPIPGSNSVKAAG